MSGVNGEQPTRGTFSFSLNRIFCCNSQRIYEPREKKRKREEKPKEEPEPESSEGSISIELVE